MCQPLKDGGLRCAAHTRPALTAAKFGTEQWDEAAANHASTRAGHKDLTAQLQRANTRGDYNKAIAIENALRAGNRIRAVAEHTAQATKEKARLATTRTETDWDQHFNHTAEATQWQQVQPPLTPTQAITWRNLGFQPYEATEWLNVHIGDEDWAFHENDAEQAATWQAFGFTPTETSKWLTDGYTTAIAARTEAGRRAHTPEAQTEALNQAQYAGICSHCNTEVRQHNDTYMHTANGTKYCHPHRTDSDATSYGALALDIW